LHKSRLSFQTKQSPVALYYVSPPKKRIVKNSIHQGQSEYSIISISYTFLFSPLSPPNAHQPYKMLGAKLLTVCGSKGQISCVLYVVCPGKQICQVFFFQRISIEAFILGVSAFVGSTSNTSEKHRFNSFFWLIYRLFGTIS